MKKIANKVYSYAINNYKEILKNLLIILITMVVCFYELPYFIYRPGGVLNVSDRIEIDDVKEISGSYNMSYVTVARGNIPNVFLSFFIKDWDIRKEEDIVIEGSDYDTTLAIEKIEMHNSLEIAKKVAYTKAGYDVNLVKKEGYIVSIDENANTTLSALDQIVSVDNIPYESIDDLRNYLSNLDVGYEVSFTVKKDDEVSIKKATIYEYENRKVVGIALLDKIEYETIPDIKFKERKSEAGSSGGLMLTLSIYDLLIPEDLNKDRIVVGTGTIDENGNVGPIGGVKYKLLGAEKENADIFFVPKENYEEAKNIWDEYELSFELVMVEKLDDAIIYLTNN